MCDGMMTWYDDMNEIRKRMQFSSQHLLNQRLLQVVLALGEERNDLAVDPAGQRRTKRTIVHHDRSLLCRRRLRLRIVVAMKWDLQQVKHIIRGTALDEDRENNQPHGDSMHQLHSPRAPSHLHLVV